MNKPEAKVLEILDHENKWMFGLEIVKQSAGSVKRASVYIHLSALEEDGWVKSRKDPNFKPAQESQLARTQYHITHEGRRAHQEHASPQRVKLIPAHG